MYVLRSQLLLTVFVLSIQLFFGPSADAQLDNEKPRTDKYGDPLPKGAVARIGTVRFLHPDYVDAVAISPNGKLVASGGYGSIVRIWDALNGKYLQKIVLRDLSISSLQFAPDGKTLGGVCGHKIFVWDVLTAKINWSRTAIGSTRHTFRGEGLTFGETLVVSVHGGDLNCTLPDKDGGGHAHIDQQVIRMWNRHTGRALALPKALESTSHDCYARIPVVFHAVGISHDAKFAAVVGSEAHPIPSKDDWPTWKHINRRLRIIELATGNTVREIKDKDTNQLAFSGDNQSLAIANERSIRLLRVRDGQETIVERKLRSRIARIEFSGRTSILTARLICDDKYGLEDTERGEFLCWDTKSIKRISEYTMRSHCAGFSRDGQLMATAHGNTIRVRHTKSGEILGGFSEHPLRPTLRFSTNRPSVFIAETSREISLLQTGTWQSIKSIQQPMSNLLSWYIDSNKELAVVRQANRYVLKDLSTGRKIRFLQGTVKYDPSAFFSDAGNRVLIREYPPPENALLIPCGPAKYYIFDVATGRKLVAIDESKMLVTIWNFQSSARPLPMLSSRGRYIAAYGEQLRIIDASNGRLVSIPKLSTDWWYGYSTDEQYFFGEYHQKNKSESFKVCAVLCDIKTGVVAHTIYLFESFHGFGLSPYSINRYRISAMALSADNRLLAIIPFGSNAVEIWEVASGQKRGKFHGHSGDVFGGEFALAFSHDGTYLASTSSDKTILIWDLHQPFTSGRFASHLSPKQLAQHWQTLAERDAKRAEFAVWAMIHTPKVSVAFLAKQFQPVAKHDDKRLQSHIADLDGGFRKRTNACAEIEKLGELALPRLLKESQKKNNLERHRRLALLIKHAEHDRIFGRSSRLRPGRALEMLEKINNADARRLLRHLAGGAESAWLTREANAALRRMGR